MTAPKFAAAVLLLLLISAHPSFAQREEPAKLQIRRGQPIVVDGAIRPGEWDDAQRLQLKAAENWLVEIHYKHDGANLLFAFSGLTRATQNPDRPDSCFPELLLDAQGRKSSNWQPGQWWLHTSFNDCEGNGEFNVYRRDGKFMCAKEKAGWTANNFPLGAEGIVEMQVSFEKVGITLDGAQTIALAINVTDTSAIWTFWPARAKLESPATWGEAVLIP